jgi:hypothetical protein
VDVGILGQNTVGTRTTPKRGGDHYDGRDKAGDK